MKPRLLDLFCKAGGASVGYARAGFEVVGVDIEPQPRYPFEFHQADALDFPLDDFDAVAASPPCQHYTALRTLSDNEHPDLVAPVRERLEAAGVPWVMENVPGAPLRSWLELCGTQFGLGADCKDGWRHLRRHRLFETSHLILAPGPCARAGKKIVGVYGNGGGGLMGRGYKGTISESREAIGTPWMNRVEVSNAIPPAYTEYIGQQLLTVIAKRAAA